MEIQGRIKQIFPSQMIGQNGFEKRDLVITTEGNTRKRSSFNLHSSVATS